MPIPQRITFVATVIKFAPVAVGTILALYILNPFVIVGPGQRGVVINFGAVQSGILNEGLHLKVPIMQKVVHMDVRVQKSEGEGSSASKDLQEVNTKVAVNYHLDPRRVAHTFQSIGTLDMVGINIILPAVQESVKAATALYTAEQLISERHSVREKIRQVLATRLIKNGIIVDDFSIVDFRFSPEFNAAIESKTTAEQLKLKAERDLARIKVEAEQKIAAAQAEAESLRIQKENVTKDLIELRRIEVQQKAIDKWDGKMPQVTGSATPFIQLQQ